MGTTSPFYVIVLVVIELLLDPIYVWYHFGDIPPLFFSTLYLGRATAENNLYLQVGGRYRFLVWGQKRCISLLHYSTSVLIIANVNHTPDQHNINNAIHLY